MTTPDEFPYLPFPDAAAFATWLEDHHATTDGIWVKFAKVSTGLPTVSYLEAVEVALCYGWIDSQKKSFDNTYWIQKFTPRRSKSIWSRVNRDKALQLITEGRMKPAGQREVERAQADGRWEAAYESQSAATVPPDLQVELDRHPDAQAFFKTISSANRYAIIFRIQTAKKPETRRAKIDQVITMLKAGQTFH